MNRELYYSSLSRMTTLGKKVTEGIFALSAIEEEMEDIRTALLEANDFERGE